MMDPEYIIISNTILIVFFLACALCFLSYILNYQDSNFVKQSAYECGFQPFEDARQSFNIEFYLVGILFVIFDLEIVFLFPLCISLNIIGYFGVFWAIIFLLILTTDSFMNGKKVLLTGKFNYVFSISFLRFTGPCIQNICIQNYYTKSTSLVDYFFEITNDKIYILFSLISKNLTYCYMQLLNITCVDNLNLNSFSKNLKRFTLFYILNNIPKVSRIILFFSCVLNSLINSISNIYKCAIWLEREIFDLFGIYFLENPDLRRILTDYGFKGFPLRKDFPLSGFLELKYQNALKQVHYCTLKFIQASRFYLFNRSYLNDNKS